MELTERSKEVIGQGIDDWFSTRPRLKAVLEAHRSEIDSLAYTSLVEMPGFAALQDNLTQAEHESDAIEGIIRLVSTAMPMIIAMLG